MRKWGKPEFMVEVASFHSQRPIYGVIPNKVKESVAQCSKLDLSQIYFHVLLVHWEGVWIGIHLIIFLIFRNSLSECGINSKLRFKKSGCLNNSKQPLFILAI